MFYFIEMKDSSYRMKCMLCSGNTSVQELYFEPKKNTLRESIYTIIRSSKTKERRPSRVLCTDFEVPMFNSAELTFLTEYAATMSPVAKAINILLAETNVQMGWLLPTINLLITKLDQIKLSLKYCKPLVDAQQLELKKRFSHVSRP
ncbi:hypothetical protein J4Q44_G00235550 [Coregonus suidteri]|uniref:Uncharacterized protein n=1 Tax=Coregonus suidteri TaxID=861788 RepID=A0AAN8LBB8_9TELE